MIKHGENVKYLDQQNKIHQAQAASDEKNGSIALLIGSHVLHDIRTINVFRTDRAANSARDNRIAEQEAK